MRLAGGMFEDFLHSVGHGALDDYEFDSDILTSPIPPRHNQTMTTVIDAEAIRTACGLTKTQFDAAVAAAGSPEQVAEKHGAFRETVEQAIAWEFRTPAYTLDGKPYLSTVQVARALGVGEFHLSNLANRNKLPGRDHGRRKVYSRSDLNAFVKRALGGGERRSSLSVAFVRWLELQARD